ncbi:head-tail connector protein [Novosphingobium lindaniclasticum]|uniref:Phage gp6-like head-tail connector protein n=1 Tax=Novosphingobium lindaniclasticum LE124 TaxID=1096930 RepID=T0H0B9_9SPHN|nr:head-tail connector protein [Novosphingobium lindaniclasticum]EQB09716.1 hypothetical protein L284_19120 [Novosphingobium lindaniclasticum LE124]
MIFELLHAPFPEGYGDAILSLEACKEHLRADSDDEDFLIQALRDASIDFVERYCSLKLGPAAGIEWSAAGFPRGAEVLTLSMGPVTAITSVAWVNRAGLPVQGSPADYRINARGDVLPRMGARWPGDIGGDVRIVFSAGYPEGKAPPSLLAAVRLFLGHLYKNREAVTDRGTEAEVPFGVQQLCGQFRRVLI